MCAQCRCHFPPILLVHGLLHQLTRCRKSLMFVQGHVVEEQPSPYSGTLRRRHLSESRLSVEMRFKSGSIYFQGPMSLTKSHLKLLSLCRASPLLKTQIKGASECLSYSGIGGQQVLAVSQNESWTPAVADSKPSSESPLPVGFREVLVLVLKPLRCRRRGEGGRCVFPHMALCLELSFGTNHSRWIQLK